MSQRAKVTFLQRRHTDGQQTHEKMLNVTITREMQIKTTIRYHLMSVRMAAIQKSTNNVGEGVEKKEPSYTVGGNAN